MYSRYIISVKRHYLPGVLACNTISSTQKAEAGGQHWHRNEPYLKIKIEKWSGLEWNIPACLACIGPWVRPQFHRTRMEGKKAGRLDPVPHALFLFPSLTHVPLNACLFVIVSAFFLSSIIHLQMMMIVYEKICCPKQYFHSL